MPRPDAAIGKQAQQPGQKLLSDFEALKSEAGDDAAVEFVAKNGAKVTNEMSSEEAWTLLQKLPRRTQSPDTRNVLQGALQTAYARGMIADEGMDFGAAFEARGSAYGLTFLEKNLDKIDPSQVETLVSQLDAMEFPDPKNNEERVAQQKTKTRRDALIRQLENITPPESKREMPGKPDLHVVSPAEEAKRHEALSRMETLKEAFDSYRGDLSLRTAEKVQKWQGELYKLREVLTDDAGLEVDSLYEQMTDYVRSVEKATQARGVVSDAQKARLSMSANQLEEARAADARRAELIKGRKPLPTKSEPQGAWGRFKSLFSK